MTDTDENAQLSQPRRWRISGIWLIPLGAALIGLWLMYQNVMSRGPEISLKLDTADGLEAGKTRIKVHSVDVGRVENVRLTEDYNGAIATVQMDPDTADLLVDDSQFWVVKPRVGRQGVSGLGTILSGAYIELRPGAADKSRRIFTVRDNPPATAGDEPGISVTLTSDDDNSLAVGDPMIYQGQTVGQVESADFSVANKRMHYRVFVRDPYASLVSEATQFWLRSGIDFHLGSDGVDVQLGSLQSVLAGGVTFGLPDGVEPGAQASDDAHYKLYPTRKAAVQQRFDEKLKYVILLDDSVRGLSSGAPVEYRGIRVGTVMEVPFFRQNFNVREFGDFKIPVLIAIEPQRVGRDWLDWSQTEWRDNLQRFFGNGLRATIKSGNLLTGAMFINLQFDENAKAYAATSVGDYPLFPSQPSQFTNIQQQLSSLVDKLNDFDIKPVVRDLKHTLEASNATLDELHRATRNINTLLEASDTQRLPGELRDVLTELSTTLDSYQQGAPAYEDFNRSLKRLNRVLDDIAPLARTLRDNPNALIFGPSDRPDPVPKARP